MEIPESKTMPATAEVTELTPESLQKMLIGSPFKSYHDLAKNCGIAPSVLYKYMKRKTKRLYAPTLLHLSQALPKYADVFLSAMQQSYVEEAATAPIATRVTSARKKASPAAGRKKK